MDLRAATDADAQACLAVQRRSAVIGYAHIFPQHDYPFPGDVVHAEWVARLASPAQVVVAVEDGDLIGTVSARPPHLEALFVVPEAWGTGVGTLLHDRALDLIAAAGCAVAELEVMADNARARRFYERHEWAPDGSRSISPFPPYPSLLGYRRPLGGRDARAVRGTIDS